MTKNYIKDAEGRTGYYGKDGREITKAGFYALHAAQMVRQIGRDAAMRHALNNGSTLALFRLAQQLSAINLTELR